MCMLMIAEGSVVWGVAFLLWHMEVSDVHNCKAFYTFKEETGEVAGVLWHKEATG